MIRKGQTNITCSQPEFKEDVVWYLWDVASLVCTRHQFNGLQQKPWIIYQLPLLKASTFCLSARPSVSSIKKGETTKRGKSGIGKRFTSRMACCVRNVLQASHGRFQLMCLCLQCLYYTAQLLSFWPSTNIISRISKIPPLHTSNKNVLFGGTESLLWRTITR